MEIQTYLSEFISGFVTILSYKPTKVIIALLVILIGIRLINSSISKFFQKTNFIEEKKEKTIESMIKSIIKYAATMGIIFYILSLYIEDFSKILAGAGIIGVILGFGAQSLIKDILSGIFFIYEKQLHKGDFIKVNGTYTGTVEEVGFRVLKVREWSGKLLAISNGEIKEIQNYNIDKMRVIEKVTTSFYQNPEEVFKGLEKACIDLNKNHQEFLLRDENEEIVEPFQVYGMTSLNENYHGYQYTVVGLVKDDVFWNAAKTTRRLIAQEMYVHNIKMAEENKFYRTKAQSKQ